MSVATWIQFDAPPPLSGRISTVMKRLKEDDANNVSVTCREEKNRNTRNGKSNGLS